MLTLHPPLPVKVFAGVLHAPDVPWDQLRERLEAFWGRADLEGAARDFSFTDYYAPEMGPDLVRHMVAFEALAAPDRLAELKIEGNRVEQEFVQADGRRRANVDVGILDYHRVILASTKEGRHKIYLGKGIWADLTLAWEKGAFKSFPWTFADFASGAYNDFLYAARERYRIAVREKRRACASSSRDCLMPANLFSSEKGTARTTVGKH